MINVPVLNWDMRPECRKSHTIESEATGYRNCLPLCIEDVGSRRMLVLSYALLTIAKRYFDIDVVATLTFSVMTNQFVRILDVPHIRFSDHMSQMWKQYTMATRLCKALASIALGKASAEHLYEQLRLGLLRAPGRESGRIRVSLPEGINNTIPSALNVSDFRGLLVNIGTRADRRRRKKLLGVETVVTPKAVGKRVENPAPRGRVAGKKRERRNIAWTDEQDALLLKVYNEKPRKKWKVIAKQHFAPRSKRSCQARLLKLVRGMGLDGVKDNNEDSMMAALKEAGKTIKALSS